MKKIIDICEELKARDLADKGTHKIAAYWESDGIRCVVMALHSHFTAYLGIPEKSKLAGLDYDELPLEVHGGLTFSRYGDDTYLPKGFYWFGWDYTHAGDYHYPGEDMIKRDPELFINRGDKKDWTLGEVKKEVEWALDDFKKLTKISEL